MLTEHNADINIRNHFGMSPLHVAANRTTSTNRNRVNTNSSWEKPGYGTTKGTVEGTRLLLKHGAIQDAEDNEGMTPLLLALKHGCHDTATCLKDGEMEHPHIFGRSDGYIGSWVLNLLTSTGQMAYTVPDTVQWRQGFEIYTYTT